jgi:hypothetical protein
MRAHLGRRGERRALSKVLKGDRRKRLARRRRRQRRRTDLSLSLSLSLFPTNARPVVLELLPEIASFSLESMPDEDP